MNDYDATYSRNSEYFGAETDPVLRNFISEIRPEGRVLDIGVGQGRNALPAARAGMSVTGIDTSAEAIAQVREVVDAAELDVDLWQGDFVDFEPEAPFDAVFCFGLMQALSRRECASLVHRLHAWTERGSILLLTARHVDDPSYDQVSAEWEPVGLHSFRNTDGEFRTYLARGAIRNLVRGWEILHHEETFGLPHSHGDGPEHSHGVIELVARRR